MRIYHFSNNHDNYSYISTHSNNVNLVTVRIVKFISLRLTTHSRLNILRKKVELKGQIEFPPIETRNFARTAKIRESDEPQLIRRDDLLYAAVASHVKRDYSFVLRELNGARVV